MWEELISDGNKNFVGRGESTGCNSYMQGEVVYCVALGAWGSSYCGHHCMQVLLLDIYQRLL